MGMVAASSRPSGPSTTSAFPPWAVMLSAISVRMSLHTPSVRGAAKTWSWTLESPISACALRTVCCSWSSSRRSCIPSTGVIRRAPRSMRSTSSSPPRSVERTAGAVVAAPRRQPRRRRRPRPRVVELHARRSRRARRPGRRGRPCALGGRLPRFSRPSSVSTVVNGLRRLAYAGAQVSRGPKPPLAPCPVSPRELLRERIRLHERPPRRPAGPRAARSGLRGAPRTARGGRG